VPWFYATGMESLSRGGLPALTPNAADSGVSVLISLSNNLVTPLS